MLLQDIRLGSPPNHYGVTAVLSTTPLQRVPNKHGYSHLSRVLGDRIRAEIERLRVAKGWSRPELGRRLNPPTSGQQIERLEKGLRQLDTDWIEKIAHALHVDPASLIAGHEGQFELTPQVADEVAGILAQITLQGGEPSPEIVRVLSIILQELSATFVRHPQARHDPQVVRPVIDLLAKRHVQQ
jgi:transcriptional regulator with XRE-family HTH domain